MFAASFVSRFQNHKQFSSSVLGYKINGSRNFVVMRFQTLGWLASRGFTCDFFVSTADAF